MKFVLIVPCVQQQLSIWGENCDEDVSDVTDKLGVLLYEVGELEDLYVDRYDQYRVTIKSIRNIEASVQPSRDRKFQWHHVVSHPPHAHTCSRPTSLQESRRSPTRLPS